LRKIYIHCGLHKTGTTAVQAIFTSKADTLAAHGVLYPRTGRVEGVVGGGHHNIAVQLTGHKHYHPSYGDIDALLREINDFDGTTILSSEAFSHTLIPPGAIGDLVKLFPADRFEVILVVYLRNQLSYVESLYIEHLGQGTDTTYAAYLDQIERDRCLRFRGSTYPVDFRPIVDVALATGAQLVLRNFHTLIGASAITDFATLVGLDLDIFADGASSRSNRRLKLRAAITAFYRNGVKRKLTNQERNAARLIAEVIGNRDAGSAPATRRIFRELFAADNRDICERFGIAPTGLDFSATAGEADGPDEAISYEQIFAEPTRALLESMIAVMLPQRPAKAIALATQHFRPAALGAGLREDRLQSA